MGLILLSFVLPWVVPLAEANSLQEMPADQAIERLYQVKKTPEVTLLTQALKTKTGAQALQKSATFSDFGFALSAESFRSEAERQLAAKKTQEALRAARQSMEALLQIELHQPISPLLKKIPELLATTEFLIAKIYLQGKKDSEALRAFENAFQRLNASPLPGGLSKIPVEVLSQYTQLCRRQKTALCNAWLQKFVFTYPKQSNESKAIQSQKADDSFFQKPPPSPRRLTQSYKATDLDLAAFEKAMALYGEGAFSRAIEALHVFLDEFPRSAHRFRARYCLAQALKQKGEEDRAKTVLANLVQDTPLSYYGLISALENGSEVERFLEATVPSVSTVDPFLSASERIHLQRAEILLAAGLTELASLELHEIRPRDPFSNSFLIYLALLNSEAGNHRDAFVVLSELIQRGERKIFSSLGLRLIFPVAHFDVIEQGAKEVGLDPILALSLIKQESAFDSLALSSSGAAGLMQLMPATAVDVDPAIERVLLTSIPANIRLGTRYLKQMLDRYQGNGVVALAAYNAGPAAVDRWLREGRGKGKGLVGFIEAIPYRETREYVASILRNYYWYQRRIRGERLSSFEPFWREVSQLGG